MSRRQILARKREALVQLCDLQRDQVADYWSHVQQPPRLMSIAGGIWTFLRQHPGLLATGVATIMTALSKRSRTVAKLVAFLPIMRTGFNLAQRFVR